MNQTSFVHTILDHPDDEGPRLVLADWLEEQGDERAAQLRRPGRWELSMSNHYPSGRVKGTIREIQLLWWADHGPAPMAALVGAVTPRIECQLLAGDCETAATEEQTASVVADVQNQLPGHYDTAACRIGGRWLCWGCATRWSKSRTGPRAKWMTKKTLRHLTGAIVTRERHA